MKKLFTVALVMLLTGCIDPVKPKTEYFVCSAFAKSSMHKTHDVLYASVSDGVTLRPRKPIKAVYTPPALFGEHSWRWGNPKGNYSLMIKRNDDHFWRAYVYDFTDAKGESVEPIKILHCRIEKE